MSAGKNKVNISGNVGGEKVGQYFRFNQCYTQLMTSLRSK